MQEIKQVLRQAQAEILHLRRTNEILQAKVEVMDFFQVVLLTKPALSSQGASEDVAWRIGQLLNTLPEDKT